VQGAPPPAPSARASAAEAAREARVGDVLRNRYRLELLIGKGTSGNVFEATDPLRLDLPPVGKRVAIKVMHPDPRGIYIEQLRQEFHHLTTLSHSNIVRAFDFDRDGALAFFTMELLSGENLFSILRARGAPLQRAHALAIIRDVADAVAHAHSRGIVHGDINPRNVFITQRGEVRVLRFGAWNRLSGNEEVSEFEQASAVPDTGRYASCEVLHGNRPTESDDLYSLSCLSYLLLTGRHAYADRTSIEARAERKHPRRPAGLTYRQWVALRGGLQTDAKKRPTDVRAWLDAMELGAAAKHLPAMNELTEAPAIKSARWQWAVAALLIVALLGGGYWYYTDPSAFGARPTTPPAMQDLSPGTDLAPTVAPPSGTPAPNAPGTGAPATATSARPAAPPPVAQRPVSPAPTARANGGLPAAGAPPAATPPIRSAALPATTASGVAAAPAASARSAPVSQAPARVEMAADTLDAAPTDSVVRVTVRRKGNLHGATSFTWWTESGTAKPGVDFAPVLPHVLQMQDGEAVTVLSVVLLPTSRSQEKGFYVGIEEADGGAQIGARSLTQITLPPTN
jgi:serine/threonine protein kinase